MTFLIHITLLEAASTPKLTPAVDTECVKNTENRNNVSTFCHVIVFRTKNIHCSLLAGSGVHNRRERDTAAYTCIGCLHKVVSNALMLTRKRKTSEDFSIEEDILEYFGLNSNWSAVSFGHLDDITMTSHEQYGDMSCFPSVWKTLNPRTVL